MIINFHENYLIQFFNEAPYDMPEELEQEETPTEGNTEDENESTDTETNDTENLNDNTEDENESEYEMDSGDSLSNSMNSSSSANSSSNGLSSDEEELTPEQASEKTKKMVLLLQFKDIKETLKNLIISASKLQDFKLNKNQEELSYIIDQANKLNDNIEFILINKFLNEPYPILLKYFLYSRNILNNLVEMLEKKFNSKDDII